MARVPPLAADETTTRQRAVREANERVAGDTDAASLLVLCECGRTTCVVRLHLSDADYRRARSWTGACIVALDHVDPALDQVIVRADPFCVVASAWPVPTDAIA
jgi:hypothetical protein